MGFGFISSSNGRHDTNVSEDFITTTERRTTKTQEFLMILVLLIPKSVTIETDPVNLGLHQTSQVQVILEFIT